jgi:hypothetical protein
MLACWQGSLLGVLIVEVVTAHGPTGAATIVRLVQNSLIRRAAESLAQHLHLTGFHGLDFILEDVTDQPLLIELNPRPTQLGHLQLASQPDLVSLFAAAALGRTPPDPSDGSLTLGDTVAFFPQALRLNPNSPHLAASHHDIPHEDPTLQELLLEDPWPDRQPLARLYLRLRPRRQQPEVRFAPAPDQPRIQPFP